MNSLLKGYCRVIFGLDEWVVYSKLDDKVRCTGHEAENSPHWSHI